MDLFLVSYLVLWFTVGVLTVVLLALTREVALLRLQLGPEPGALATKDGPKIGADAPPLQGALLAGGKISRAANSRPALVLFISPGCGPCRELLPHVRKFARGRKDIDLYLVSQSDLANARALAEAYEIVTPVVVDPDLAISRQFRVERTPYGLAMDGDWVLRSKGVTNTVDHLEALADFQITAQGSNGSRVNWRTPDGTPLPALAENKGARDGIIG
jgi:methylamine dehydrogenase accessory protein MauD